MPPKPLSRRLKLPLVDHPDQETERSMRRAVFEPPLQPPNQVLEGRWLTQTCKSGKTPVSTKAREEFPTGGF